MQPRVSRTLFVAVVAVLGVSCLAGLWLAADAIPLHVSLDPNEGWNAYFAAAAMAGRGPYPDAAGFLTNNYPPLSFYFVGWLGQATGDGIVAGRVVSFVSFFGVAAFVGALAFRFGCRTVHALFAAFFFAGFLLLTSDYVGMDDPQLLGHALQMAGLVLLFSPRRSWARDVAVSALFVVALFVKHNLVALPVATLCWLAVSREGSASRLGALLLIFGAAGLLVFRAAFGFDLMFRLAAPRVYSISLLFDNLHAWLPLAALPLAATFAAAALRARGALFAALYGLVGLGFGIASLAGAGVDVNAMFDADIAIALGAAIALKTLEERATGIYTLLAPGFAAVVLLPFVVLLATNYDSSWLEKDFWLHPLQDEAAQSEADIAWLRAQNGPAMCQSLALCYWAGKPATVDVFNLGQQLATGARRPDAFLHLVDTHAFSAIQFDSLTPFPFPQAVHDAILANYRVARTDDIGVFLVPKGH